MSHAVSRASRRAKPSVLQAARAWRLARWTTAVEPPLCLGAKGDEFCARTRCKRNETRWVRHGVVKNRPKQLAIKPDLQGIINTTHDTWDFWKECINSFGQVVSFPLDGKGGCPIWVSGRPGLPEGSGRFPFWTCRGCSHECRREL